MSGRELRVRLHLVGGVNRSRPLRLQRLGKEELTFEHVWLGRAVTHLSESIDEHGVLIRRLERAAFSRPVVQRNLLLLVLHDAIVVEGPRTAITICECFVTHSVTPPTGVDMVSRGEGCQRRELQGALAARGKI